MASQWVIVVHDPDRDGGDYVVGPFDHRPFADEYASGMKAVIGKDGAALVLELEDPFELTVLGLTSGGEL